MTFATAEARCAALGEVTCDYESAQQLEANGCSTDNQIRMWSAAPCAVLAHVSADTTAKH